MGDFTLLLRLLQTPVERGDAGFIMVNNKYLVIFRFVRPAGIRIDLIPTCRKVDYW